MLRPRASSGMSSSRYTFRHFRHNTTLTDILASRNPLPYNELELEQKSRFIKDVISAGGEVNVEAVKKWCEKPTSAKREELLKLATPTYKPQLREILSGTIPNGLPFLIQLRSDVIFLKKLWLRDSSEPRSVINGCHELDDCIKDLLKLYFSVGLLELRHIKYDNSPASTIESIAKKESNHPIQSLQDLKKRLGEGRRCYGFFHGGLVGEPIIFVHVRLLRKGVARGMQDIHSAGEEDESKATSAIFYSINATKPGLAGIDLGNTLIKSVAQTLKAELPALTNFCTLSPIPGFREWLRKCEYELIILHSSITSF